MQFVAGLRHISDEHRRSSADVVCVCGGGGGEVVFLNFLWSSLTESARALGIRRRSQGTEALQEEDESHATGNYCAIVSCFTSTLTTSTCIQYNGATFDPKVSRDQICHLLSDFNAKTSSFMYFFPLPSGQTVRLYSQLAGPPNKHTG